MDTVQSILQITESSIKNDEERYYFWTHQVRYAYILQKVLEIAKGKRLTILDIGCFPYHVGKALEIMGHTVYGISSHHEPVSNKNISVLNIETDKFPYKNNFFDLVLCNEVIEHLPQSPIMPLKEMHRVLKKEGKCMVTTPNIVRSINRFKIVMGFNISYPVEVYFENNGQGNNIYHRHNREYTLSELSTVIKHGGFHVEKKDRFISYAPYRKRKNPDGLILMVIKWLNYLLMICVGSFKDTLFVLGKKTS